MKINSRKWCIFTLAIFFVIAFGSLGKAKDITWTAKTPMPTPRMALTSGVVNGKIYVIGGHPGTTKVEEYNPATNTWTQKASMPTPRDSLCAGVVNNKIYAIGGWNSWAAPSTGVNTVEEYNPAANTWSTKTPMPTARYLLGCGVVNDRIYVIGGNRWLGGHLTIVEEYDPATGTWTTKSPMPTPRYSLTVAVVNNKIYAIGGSAAWGIILNTVDEYDPATNTWRSGLTPMPTARYALASAVVKDKIYVIGGVGKGDPILNTVEEYDPATNTWRSGLTPVSTVCYALTSVAVEDKIYVIGGYSPGIQYLNTVEEGNLGFFAPQASASANPTSGRAPLGVTFTGTGTDTDGTITKYEWDFDGNGTYDWSSTSSGNTTHTYSVAGTYNATLRVTDNDNLTGTDSVTITVSPAPKPPTASASASPTSGKAPLEVAFTGTGTDSDGTITKYEWDFDGDGTYDWSSAAIGGQDIIVNGDFSTGDATGWTFDMAIGSGILGNYEIVNNTARIYRTGAGSYGRGSWLYQDHNVDVSNATALSLSFKVKVDYQSLSGFGRADEEPPAYVQVGYTDVNGQERYYWRGFYYTGTSSNPNAEKISQSTWVSRSYDLTSLSPKPATIKRVYIVASGWDYDSSFDDIKVRWGTSGNTSHTYTAAGTYNATLRVTDNDGLTDTDSVTITVSAALKPPTASASANPTSGLIPLTVNFTGTGTDSDGTITKYEWDFDGDGVYDWGSPTSGNTTYTYEEVGSYTAKLRVTDNDNLTGTDTVTITVQQPSELKVWISVPKDGDSIWGDGVSLRANTAPGELTKSVQFQYKASTNKTWINLGDPIFPPPYSFPTTWDVTSLTPGNYNLRAVATDTEDNLVYASPITLTVTSQNPKIWEGKNVGGNHEKKEKITKDKTEAVKLFDKTMVKIPYGALDADTTVHTILYNATTTPVVIIRTRFITPTDIYKEFNIAEGAYGFNRDITITIPYPDVDNDGILDGTGIKETTLAIYHYNESTRLWERVTGSTIYLSENYVSAQVNQVSLFTLVGTTSTGGANAPSSGGGGGGGGCLIATAAYGTPIAEEERILCKFRDRHLLTNRAGRAFISLYNKFSPPVARFIQDKESLKTIVRIGLKPFVWIAKRTTK